MSRTEILNAYQNDDDQNCGAQSACPQDGEKRRLADQVVASSSRRCG